MERFLISIDFHSEEESGLIISTHSAISYPADTSSSLLAKSYAEVVSSADEMYEACNGKVNYRVVLKNGKDIIHEEKKDSTEEIDVLSIVDELLETIERLGG